MFMFINIHSRINWRAYASTGFLNKVVHPFLFGTFMIEFFSPLLFSIIIIIKNVYMKIKKRSESGKRLVEKNYAFIFIFRYVLKKTLNILVFYSLSDE